MKIIKRSPSTRNRSARERERGQSLVEFALSLVAITWLLAIILDLGRAYYTLIALENAAEEGAAYASIDPTCLCSCGSECASPNNAEWRAKHESRSGPLDPDLVTVDFTYAALTPGSQVTVSASYPHKITTPLGGTILGTDTITLTGEATRVVIVSSD